VGDDAVDGIEVDHEIVLPRTVVKCRRSLARGSVVRSTPTFASSRSERRGMVVP
jgi:hypothetical protein